jgi:hypothetical protein
VHAAIFEDEPGSGGEVFQSAACEDFPGASKCGYACCNVHCDSSDVIATQFDFAGMNACPKIQTKWCHLLCELGGETGSASRPVEGGEHPVTGALHHSTTLLSSDPLRRLIVFVQHVAPFGVAEPGGKLG